MPELESCEMTFSQEMHCCGPKDLRITVDASLTIRTADGGAGFYLVITATEWAINPLDGENHIDAIQRVARILGAL